MNNSQNKKNIIRWLFIFWFTAAVTTIFASLLFEIFKYKISIWEKLRLTQFVYDIYGIGIALSAIVYYLKNFTTLSLRSLLVFLLIGPLLMISLPFTLEMFNPYDKPDIKRYLYFFMFLTMVFGIIMYKSDLLGYKDTNEKTLNWILNWNKPAPKWGVVLFTVIFTILMFSILMLFALFIYK